MEAGARIQLGINVLDFLSDFGIYGRRSTAGLSELLACAVNKTNSAPVRLGVLVTAHSEIIHMPHERLCSNALSLTTPAVSRVFLFSLSLNSSNRRSSEGLVH